MTISTIYTINGVRNMKSFFRIFAILMAVFFFMESFAIADTYVQGYTRKDGTYVQGHYRSRPNSTVNDNYSTQGNTNPYTGQMGTKPRENDYFRSNSNPQKNNYGGTNRLMK